MHFLELSPNKILNKVVCDFHFKENNFMNYKRERLTKTNAIPTIYISPKSKAEIDLLIHPTEWVGENQKKALPTSFQNPVRINIDESSNAVGVTEDPIVSFPPPKKMKLDVSTVRILNGSATSSADSAKTVQRFVKKLPTVNESAQEPKVLKLSGERYTIRKVLNSPLITSTPKIIKSEIIQSHSDQVSKKLFEHFDTSVIELKDIPEKVATSSNDHHLISSNPETIRDDLKPILMDSLKQIAEIKNLLNEKQVEIVPATPKESDDDSNITQSQFNKVQLFNGIKRYLSPSMNALLRIELFSTPGREYKKDEKIICQELLLLGDKAYSFLNDEWRLRLPAKKEVQKWLDEQTTEEDDDAS